MTYGELQKIYQQLVQKLEERDLTAAAMESCTGGLIANLFTDISGASRVFYGCYVAYTNKVKTHYLVDPAIIGTFGVYSEQTAAAMARCAAEGLETEIGIGVTGTLGRKDPGNDDSTPGITWLAVYFRGKMRTGIVETAVEEDTPENRFAAKMKIAQAAADLIAAVCAESL